MASPRTINQQAALGSTFESINVQGQQAIDKLENIRDVQIPRERSTITNSTLLTQGEKDEANAELDAIAQTLIDRIVALHDSVTT